MRMRVLGTAVAAACALVSGIAGAASFTPGNIVVFRAGDGSGTLGSAAAAAFLDERTPAGVLVQSIALPTSAAGANLACTTVGSASNDGSITLSSDGQYLVGPCYAATPGTTGLAATTSALVPRVAFRVGANGVVDSSTSTNAQFSGGNIRAVASSDGSKFWADGSNTGVVFLAYGATSGTIVATTVTNNRAIGIADGQLYASNGSGANTRVKTVGTGLPETATTMADMTGLPTATTNGNQFLFADLTGSVAGVDTLYLADDGGNAIRKFSLVAGTWTLNGTIDAGGAYRGLAGTVGAGSVTLYATKAGTTLVTVTDTAGYNAAPSTTAVTTIATNATNTAFRGVALVPQAVAAPTLSIATTASVAEGNTGCVGITTALNFTVTSSSPAASNINFTFTTADGTAASGSDFTSTGTGTITTGNSTGNATVQVSCDDTYEADETFTVTLTDVSNPAYDLGSPITGTGTITNDDAAPTIQVSAGSVNLGESGSATFDVTLSGATIGSTVFNVASNDTGAATVSPATLTFSPGDFGTPQTVTVSGVADVDLANESATVSITSAGYTTANVSANVTDDDTQAIVVSPTSLGLTEGTGSSLNVSLAFQPAGSVTVNVASLDAGAASATPASLIFTPANYFTTQAVTVAGEQDVDTANESTSIEFTASGISTTSVAVTVTDDDTALPTVTLTGGNAVAEGNGCTTSNVAFTASSSQPAGAGGLTVHYTITAGTADAGDLTLGAGSVLIPQSASTANFNVPVNCDFAVESNETFDVALAADAGYTIGSPSSASGTITNDDVNLTLSLAPVSQSEGNGTSTMTFTASLNQAVPAGYGPVAFTLGTADVSATAGSDYVTLSEAKSIAEGASSTTFVVTINGDTTVEADETFNVDISATSGQNTTFPSNPAAVGTIQNDDNTTTISVPATASIAEGNLGTSTATVTVSTDTVPLGGSASVNYATAGASATSGNDFVDANGTANITCAAGPALPCTAPINITINGDLRSESSETFTLTLSNPVGTNVVLGNAVTTVTITNDDTVQELTIEQIQGNTHASPVANQTVATLGNIITAVLPAPNGGFIMQMPDALASGDTATSNGVYVYTGGSPSGVAIGDEVDVRGQVVEFNSSGGATAAQRVTEFTNTGLLYSVRSSGNTLPNPVTLDASVPSPNPATPSCGAALGNFECLEGMRVTTTTGMVNLGNQTFGSDPVAEMWITTSGQRAVREGGLLPTKTGEVVPTLNPPASPVPSTYVYDQNPEVFELDMDRAGLPNTILVPGTSFSATGVLVQEFGGFELWPTSLTVDTAAPALPAPVVDALPTELTIGSQNLHLLFDDVNDPWNTVDCTPGPDFEIDFCPDTARWNAKLNLLSRQIREQLKSPMVVAHQEIEKLGALQALAAKVNADLGVGSPFTYSAHMGAIDNLDGGHQNVGFLVRSDIEIVSIEQLNTTQMWSFNGTNQGEVMDRPPLLLRARTTAAPGAPFEFAVMALHQRSLSGIDNLSTSVDPDNSPLTYIQNAHRVRQKRLYQAALTAQAIQQFQTENSAVPLYVLGDFNAYTESDGYADVTGIILGTTDPALSQYDLSFFGLEGNGPNGNIVVPALTAASALAPANERYSYQFQSMPQQIDHAAMNAAGLDHFLDIHFARNNVDQQARYLISFSNTLGTETPLVSSDHDGFVLYVDPRADGLFGDGFE